jgi:hypothetical protein
MRDALPSGMTPGDPLEALLLGQLVPVLVAASPRELLVAAGGHLDAMAPAAVVFAHDEVAAVEQILACGSAAIVTHPYQGLDEARDRAALVARAAARVLARRGASPLLLEMTGDEPFATGPHQRAILLDDATRAAKRRRLAGPWSLESFRLAPDHDFARPPEAVRYPWHAWHERARRTAFAFDLPGLA